MILIEIDNTKAFTSHLFIKETFDKFCVSDVSITTFAEFNIDGRLKKSFYSSEEQELLTNDTFAKWSDIKPICFNIIKGDKSPLKFRITLHLAQNSICKFLENNHSNFSATDVNSLSLNVRFENKKITCTTGTSLNQFTLDKSIDEIWDNYIYQSLHTIPDIF